MQVYDRLYSGEVLADQIGVGGVLTFNFSIPCDIIEVRCDGGNGRADPYGGTPSSNTGIVCEDGIPKPWPITTNSVRVYAPLGVVVSVHGARYLKLPHG